MTEKWGQIQGKWDLVQVSGEFELSEFELPGLYCTRKLQLFRTVNQMKKTLKFQTFRSRCVPYLCTLSIKSNSGVH